MKPLIVFRTAAALCLLLIVGAVSPSFARGPGGGRVVPSGTETCSVSPNPTTNGQQYFVTGAGYKPGQILSIFVGSGSILMTAADGNGAFSAWGWATFAFSGSKDVKIYQQGDRKKTVRASCSFMAN